QFPVGDTCDHTILDQPSNDSHSDQLLSDSETAAEFLLSHGQKALWFLQRLSTESGANNCAYAGRTLGQPDIPAFQRAIYRLAERHPILRTTFPVAHFENGSEKDGEPTQRVHARPLAGCFVLIDASEMSQAELSQQLKDAIHHRFDLERGPLLRAFLFKL